MSTCKETHIFIFVLNAFLIANSAIVINPKDFKDAENSFVLVNGTVSTECDCGEYGVCEFENGQKKCTCAPLSIEFDGKCVECDCGEYSNNCTYRINGSKQCICYPKYVDLNGKCTECDCGDHGLCKFEFGRKKCICSPGFVEARGICQACECGEETYSCTLDSSGEKKCTCLGKYEPNNGYCEECYCGRSGRCSFENGLKKCDCDWYYSENNGTCEFCTCGKNANSCNFDERGDKKCNCYRGFGDKNGNCEECNCGYYSTSCLFENGKKRCLCTPDAVEKEGYCVVRATTTTPKVSTFLISTTQDFRTTPKDAIDSTTPNSNVSPTGKAICNDDKCFHGKCVIVENNFKCRCYEGFTGHRCEEKIQTKSDKRDVWMIVLLSIALVIFVMLSALLCLWTRILNKMSKK